MSKITYGKLSEIPTYAQAAGTRINHRRYRTLAAQILCPTGGGNVTEVFVDGQKIGTITNIMKVDTMHNRCRQTQNTECWGVKGYHVNVAHGSVVVSKPVWVDAATNHNPATAKAAARRLVESVVANG